MKSSIRPFVAYFLSFLNENSKYVLLGVIFDQVCGFHLRLRLRLRLRLSFVFMLRLRLRLRLRLIFELRLRLRLRLRFEPQGGVWGRVIKDRLIYFLIGRWA